MLHASNHLLQVLVPACHTSEGERQQAAARAALRSITRDSMQLQEAALDAGAESQWLL